MHPIAELSYPIAVFYPERDCEIVGDAECVIEIVSAEVEPDDERLMMIAVDSAGFEYSKPNLTYAWPRSRWGRRLCYWLSHGMWLDIEFREKRPIDLEEFKRRLHDSGVRDELPESSHQAVLLHLFHVEGRGWF